MLEQLFKCHSKKGENPFGISCNKLTAPILGGGGGRD